MRTRSLLKLAAVILLLASCGAGSVLAQGTKQREITKAVYWSDAQSGVEVYLAQGGSRGYRLTVVSSRDVKVTYRTSINSVEPVSKELVPINSLGNSVRQYEFEHYFSKMTIWMGLEFTVDGKAAPGLTRTFYNDIFTLVPEHFFGGPKKEGRKESK